MGILKTISVGLLCVALMAVGGCSTLAGNPEGPVIRTSLHHAVTVFTPYGQGSGVWIADDLILTAKHVVSFDSSDRRVGIETLAGDTYEVELIAGGPGTGVEHGWAILRVPADKKRHHGITTSCEAVDYGGRVVAIGNAAGVTGLIPFIGRVEQINYNIAKVSGQDSLWLHTFLASFHGAGGVSGGPVINMHGELVGIVVAEVLGGVAKASYPTTHISALCGETR